jgi:hypothetical protein
MKSSRTITLPENLCFSAETKFAHRFGSLEEFLTAVLNRVLEDGAVRTDEKEQQIIEERLKGLGYI